MKLITLQQFEKKSRGSLMRFINGYLKTQSKKRVAIFAYALAKSKLPRLKVRKSLAYNGSISRKRKTKRRASPKQIAWRKKFAKMSKAGTLRKRRC